MRIRPAVVEDATSLSEIVVAGWRWAYRGIIPDEELATLDLTGRIHRFRERFNPEILFLVAVDDWDVPMGYAAENNPPNLPQFDAEIGSLYVDPVRTRSGVGTALFAAMVQRFLERGANSMAIHTLQQNLIGRSFYERKGGTVILEDDWRGHAAVWYGWQTLSQTVTLGQVRTSIESTSKNSRALRPPDTRQDGND